MDKYLPKMRWWRQSREIDRISRLLMIRRYFGNREKKGRSSPFWLNFNHGLRLDFSQKSRAWIYAIYLPLFCVIPDHHHVTILLWFRWNQFGVQQTANGIYALCEQYLKAVFLFQWSWKFHWFFITNVSMSLSVSGFVTVSPKMCLCWRNKLNIQ